MWMQETIKLKPYSRGFHLISHEIQAKCQGLSTIEIGLAHLFIQHSSASLTINENADADVRIDMESYFNTTCPENAPYYEHTCEGPDDMPAHLKASILGSSVSIPITNGRLNMGIWQGVYLGEHRDHGGSRSIVITLQGMTFS